MSDDADNYLAHLGIEVGNELKHYGKKGMKWGVRNETPAKLESRETDTQVTRKVKADYNNMDDASFARKYATSKKSYARRVEKHGDPYAARFSQKDRDIMEARDRQGARAADLQRQAFKTYSAEGEKAAKAAMNKYDKMETDLLVNPDATTAAKLTRGEAIANGVAWGVIAVGLATTLAAAARS